MTKTLKATDRCHGKNAGKGQTNNPEGVADFLLSLCYGLENIYMLCSGRSPKGFVMDEEELKQKLIALKQEHRDLDDALLALERAGTFDQVQMQRLKKKKLRLKDKITKIEDKLLPDIIA